MDLDTSSAPRLVRTLAARGLWLEQECVVLDVRTEKSLMAIATEFGKGA